MDRGILEELRDLGLTRYEAMCYISLLGLGPADPRTVAADAGIPHPNSYESLRRLERRGWVELVTKRPASYRARRPDVIKEMIASRLETTFEVLSRLYRAVPAAEAEMVYTLRGRDKVLSKVYEMIEGARQSLVLVSPTLGLEERVLRLVREAVARGVTVRAIVDEAGARLLPGRVEVRSGNLIAIDILADDTTAMISLPDYSACGWVDSPQVASHFKQFLELMWSNSRGPVKKRVPPRPDE